MRQKNFWNWVRIKLLARNEGFTDLIAWNDWNPTVRLRYKYCKFPMLRLSHHSTTFRACHVAKRCPKQANKKQEQGELTSFQYDYLRSFKTIVRRTWKGLINKWLKFHCKNPFKEISLHAFGTWILMDPTTILLMTKFNHCLDCSWDWDTTMGDIMTIHLLKSFCEWFRSTVLVGGMIWRDFETHPV